MIKIFEQLNCLDCEIESK